MPSVADHADTAVPLPGAPAAVGVPAWDPEVEADSVVVEAPAAEVDAAEVDADDCIEIAAGRVSEHNHEI